MTPFGTRARELGPVLGKPDQPVRHHRSAPPPWEKIHLILGQRFSVPPNSRLTMARVVSNGNSMSAAESGDHVEGEARAR